MFKAGDMVTVLHKTEHYNLMLLSHKLAPKWLGPLQVEEVRGPNTVHIQVPPCLGRIKPLQNIAHLKPYVSRPADIGHTGVQLSQPFNPDWSSLPTDMLQHQGTDAFILV
eukprot:3892824-Rhodomonas_salina.1